MKNFNLRSESIGIITQARLGSSRLPAKILRKIRGKTILEYHLERLSTPYFPVYLATTKETGIEEVLYICQRLNVLYYQGDLEDVLTRFYQTAKEFKLDHIVRVTSDCPLIDGHLIAKAVQDYLSFSRLDVYHSNCRHRTYPRGFDFEIFSFAALSEAYERADRPEEREHVTPYLYKASNKNILISDHLRSRDASSYRVTLDTEEDWIVIEELISRHQAHLKSAEEIISILEKNPQLAKINAQVTHRDLPGKDERVLRPCIVNIP